MVVLRQSGSDNKEYQVLVKIQNQLQKKLDENRLKLDTQKTLLKENVLLLTGLIKSNGKDIQVVWKDAQGGANVGWRELDELTQAKVATAVSCGAVLVNDEDKIIICPHMLVEDGKITEGDAELVIPKQWVVSMEELGVLCNG
jgi:hypothetical protein